MAATAYHVPGVYYEPQPRALETPLVRTDVVGFIGFDPRVVNGTTPSTLTWLPSPSSPPPDGHAFRVDVAGFQLMVGAVRGAVPATRDFVLSEDPTSIPIVSGVSIVYALVVREAGGVLTLAVHAGTAAVSGGEQAPDDEALRAVFGPSRWVRISDVTVRRELDAVFVTARPTPALSITRCDDLRDYVLAFGTPPDDGTLLGPAVRAFFANGGRRCWVATLRRPGFEDRRELGNVLDDMVGRSGSSQLEATGLERLLLVPEVTIVDAPDLYALRVDRTVRNFPLPPSEREACFLPCHLFPPPGTATSNERTPAWTPVFESSPVFDGSAPLLNEVFATQARLLARCVLERWRVLLLLSVPRLPDAGSGPYLPPTGRDALAWRTQFDYAVKGKLGAPSVGDTNDVSCAALYWPWVIAQEQVDGPILEMPPAAYAAGIIARRDLSRGPQISPANETLRQVVALSATFDDTVHGDLYDPPDVNGFPVLATNVLRAFPGYGIQLWGARTLSTETWLRFLSVRRTLTAIELRMKAALMELVFEPNRPALWLQIVQTAFGVLLPIFESGALRGARPEEAFYVRCDGRNNPPDAMARGELLVEVGVAVAAPMEFIVFRVGRREGVIEVLE